MACLKKLDSIKVTKSDEKLIYAIGCLTFQENKKSIKVFHFQLAQFCNCSEKTVQRSIAKLEKAKLIKRVLSKWKNSGGEIHISSDFHRETRSIFKEQKEVFKRLGKMPENIQLIMATKKINKDSGPLTVGRLIRTYRFLNSISIKELAIVLDLTKTYISGVETGRKLISLDQALNICKRLKESKDVYAQVWFEEQSRNAGLDFKKLVKKLQS